MARKKGLLDKIQLEALEKGEETLTSMMFGKPTEEVEEEFEKKRQTIYLKENLVQAIKYKAFKENKTITDIFNDLVESSLSEEELQVGNERTKL